MIVGSDVGGLARPEDSKTSELTTQVTCGGIRIDPRESKTEIKPRFSDSLLSALTEITIREFGS